MARRVHFAHFAFWGDNIEGVFSAFNNDQHVCWKTKDKDGKVRSRCLTITLCGNRYEGAWFNRVVRNGKEHHVAPDQDAPKDEFGQMRWKLTKPLNYKPIRMTSFPEQVTCRRCASYLHDLGLETHPDVVLCMADTDSLIGRNPLR